MRQFPCGQEPLDLDAENPRLPFRAGERGGEVPSNAQMSYCVIALDNQANNNNLMLETKRRTRTKKNIKGRSTQQTQDTKANDVSERIRSIIRTRKSNKNEFGKTRLRNLTLTRSLLFFCFLIRGGNSVSTTTPKPYELTGFGGGGGQNPYEFIGILATTTTEPC